MLEKVKTIAKKHDNICVVILITLITLGLNLNQKISNGDEVWCFQHLYKLYNGCKIYTDVNIITTPLYWYIGLGFLKILGANILSLRIYHEIILILVGTTTYQILKKLGLTKPKALVSLAIIMCLGLFKQISSMYNGLSLALTLIGILNLIKKQTPKQPYIQGIIIFLIIMTKQNIGVYYAIGLIIYELISNKSKKEKAQAITKEIITAAALISLTCVIMQINGTLEGLLNYTIFNIKEFSKENVSILTASIIRILIMIVAIILAIIIVKNKKIKTTQKTKENLKILAIFSAIMSLIIYPINNEHHSVLAFHISYILLIYIIFEILAKDLIEELISKKAKEIITLLVATVIATLSVINIINIVEWSKKVGNAAGTPYFGGILEQETKENITKVNNYIKEANKKVIILSTKAALYNIPEKRNNGPYDLPSKGNLGKEGEDGIIQKIQQLKNTEILIEKEEKEMFWQESKKIREYITKNLTPKGEIEEFSIYETKNIDKNT